VSSNGAVLKVEVQGSGIVAVSSAKVGVGKTNVVATLSVYLPESGKKVIVLDADLGLANIDVLLGLTLR
jgi:flagellar biosynthesis protein FlhG